MVAEAWGEPVVCGSGIHCGVVVPQFRTPTSSSRAGSVTQSLIIPVTRTTARSHLFLKLRCHHLIPKLVCVMSLVWDSTAWICSLICFLSKGKDWGEKNKLCCFAYEVIKIWTSRFSTLCKVFHSVTETFDVWFPPEEAVGILLPTSLPSSAISKPLAPQLLSHLGTVAKCVFMVWPEETIPSKTMSQQLFQPFWHLSVNPLQMLEVILDRFGCCSATQGQFSIP